MLKMKELDELKKPIESLEVRIETEKMGDSKFEDSPFYKIGNNEKRGYKHLNSNDVISACNYCGVTDRCGYSGG